MKVGGSLPVITFFKAQVLEVKANNSATQWICPELLKLTLFRAEVGLDNKAYLVSAPLLMKPWLQCVTPSHYLVTLYFCI